MGQIGRRNDVNPDLDTNHQDQYSFSIIYSISNKLIYPNTWKHCMISYRKCGSMVTLEIQRPCPSYDRPETLVCMNPNGLISKSDSSCASVQEFSIYDERAYLLHQSSFVRFKPFHILSKLKSKSTFSLSLSRMQRLWIFKLNSTYPKPFQFHSLSICRLWIVADHTLVLRANTVQSLYSMTCYSIDLDIALSFSYNFFCKIVPLWHGSLIAWFIPMDSIHTVIKGTAL